MVGPVDGEVVGNSGVSLRRQMEKVDAAGQRVVAATVGHVEQQLINTQR